jgi:hypothetical protein
MIEGRDFDRPPHRRVARAFTGDRPTFGTGKIDRIDRDFIEIVSHFKSLVNVVKHCCV